MPPNKKKSKIWNYFKKCDNDKEAVCKLCNKNLRTSGNTSNMRGHLDKVHPEVNQEVVAEEPVAKKNKTCNDDNIKEEVQCEQPLTSTSTATDVVIVDSKHIANRPTSNIKELFNNIKSISCAEGNKHKKITESIVNFIIMDHKPFSVVEGKEFIQLMKEVVPLYKIPSRETF